MLTDRVCAHTCAGDERRAAAALAAAGSVRLWAQHGTGSTAVGLPRPARSEAAFPRDPRERRVPVPSAGELGLGRKINKSDTLPSH